MRDVMHTSETRMLTTHVGSLPRSPRLTELLLCQERGEAVDEAELALQAETAVETVVRKQLEVGIDIGNDGEQPHVAFHTYVARRMRGFGGGWVRPVRREGGGDPHCRAECGHSQYPCRLRAP